MSRLSSFFSPSRKPRIVAVVLAVALLHLLAFEWTEGHFTLPSFPQPEEKVVTTALLAPPATPPTTAVHPRPAEPRKRRPAPPPVKASPPASIPEPAVTEADPSSSSNTIVSDAAPEASTAGMEAPGTSVETPVEIPAATSTVPPQQTEASYKIDPPPSVQLDYDVQTRQKGQTYYGHGRIAWKTAGNSYRIDGDAGVLFLTLLNFSSEGMIDEFGVSPVIYSEKRFRRSETATHFHRGRNTISFSASTVTYPRKGGEQDRASLVWQLAGIGRGDSTKFAPGTSIDLMVAGVRDAEVWRIQIIGQEEVEVGSGKFMAWHVSRLPRPGSYEQALDIWFAPQREWYPVRLRFTETNGDYLDMSLSKLTMGTPSS